MLCTAILLNSLFFQLELFLNWASNLVFTKPPRICGFLHSAMKILGKKSRPVLQKLSFVFQDLLLLLYIVNSVKHTRKKKTV